MAFPLAIPALAKLAPILGKAAPALIGAGANIFSGALGAGAANQQNDILRRFMENALTQAGYSRDRVDEILGPVREGNLAASDIFQQLLLGSGDAPGMLPTSFNQQQDLLQQISNPDFFRQSSMTPGMQEDLDRMRTTRDRLDPAYDFMYSILGDQGRTPESSQLMDRLFDQYGGAGLHELRNVGNEILQNRGGTEFTQNTQQRANEVLNAMGSTPATQGGGGVAFDVLANQGYTPSLNNMIGTGQNFLDQAMATGGYSPGTAQGFDLSNQAFNTGQGLINNAGVGTGYTPELYAQGGMGADLFERMMSSGGYDPQIMDVLGQGMSMLQNPGQFNSAFDFLNLGGPGGGITAPQIQAAMAQISDPTFEGLSADALRTRSQAADDFAAGGRTDLTGAMAQNVMDILGGRSSTIMSPEMMMAFAKDQAATTGQAASEKAMRDALNRGLGPGSVASGGQSGAAMRDFFFDRARLESQAVQDAMLRNQELRLAEQGMAHQSGAATAGAENQRYGTAGNVVSNLEGVDASRYGSFMGAQGAANAARVSAAGQQNQVGIANAQLQMQAAQMEQAQKLAQAQLIGNLMGQTMGSGTNLATAGLGNATQRFTTGTGQALDAVSQMNQIAANRFGTEANIYGTDMGAGTALMGQGIAGTNAAEQNAINRFTSMLQPRDLMIAGEANATQRMGQGADLLTNILNNENARAQIYGTLGVNAGQQEINRMLAGAGMLDQFSQNQNQSAQNIMNLLNLNSNREFNAVTGITNLAGTQGALGNNIFGNQIQAQNQGLNQATAFADANNRAINTGLAASGQALQGWGQANQNLLGAAGVYGGMFGASMPNVSSPGFANPNAGWQQAAQNVAQAAGGINWTDLLKSGASPAASNTAGGADPTGTSVLRIPSYTPQNFLPFTPSYGQPQSSNPYAPGSSVTPYMNFVMGGQQ